MKRFYREATVAETTGGWQVLLDGRSIKTPGGALQIVPNRPIAELLAAEWASQGDELDASSFAHRDIADYAIDHILPDPAKQIQSLLRYAETDTLCYRADPDEPLFARQQEVWDPLLTGLEEKYLLQFERISGVIHRPQPAASLRKMTDLLQVHNAYTLSALACLISLSSSFAIGLLALENDADAETLWAAANLEEDWQAEQWGWDHAAEELRTRRAGEFSNAHLFVRLTLSR